MRGHSPAFRVFPAAATHFRVEFFTSSITTGRALDVRVTALNDGNVVDRGYRGTIDFTSTDPGAQLPADYTFTAGDAGQHTFTNGVTFATGGGRSASVNDLAVPTRRGDSGPILAIFDGATRLQVSVFNGSGTQGRTFDATVRALNDRGDVDPSYRGTIQFGSSDPAATVPPNYTFTSGDAGTKTFTGLTIFNTPGYRNLSARDTSTTVNIQGFSSAVSILPSAATRLRVVPAPSAVNPGEAVSLTVTAVNDRGDKDAAYRGTVQFTSTDTAATMPANYTFTAGDTGRENARQRRQLRHTRRAVDPRHRHRQCRGAGYSTDVLVRNGPAPTTTTTTGSSTTTTVPGTTTTTVAGSAVRLEVSMPLGDVTAGQPRDVSVTARDSQGRIATSYAGTVHFTSTDPGAVLPADYTFIAADAGTRNFPGGVRFATAGNQRVTVTDTVNATVTGDGPTILVFDPSATHFTFAFTTSSATSGEPTGVTVERAQRAQRRRHRVPRHGSLHVDRPRRGAAG